ncbi:hypothetical protein, partial [Klebsiella pneumoniae]|uniref:hypothetical protein n=1 Tax=Klebsiella pneumoniae TaxID=573 RepID=UPI000B3B1D94
NRERNRPGSNIEAVALLSAARAGTFQVAPFFCRVAVLNKAMGELHNIELVNLEDVSQFICKWRRLLLLILGAELNVIQSIMFCYEI